MFFLTAHARHDLLSESHKAFLDFVWLVKSIRGKVLQTASRRDVLKGEACTMLRGTDTRVHKSSAEGLHVRPQRLSLAASALRMDKFLMLS